MDGVQVVAFIVRCGSNLLICEDVDTAHMAFLDIEDCRGRLPATIQMTSEAGDQSDIVMGKCRFLPGQPRVSTAEQPPTHDTVTLSGRGR